MDQTDGLAQGSGVIFRTRAEQPFLVHYFEVLKCWAVLAPFGPQPGAEAEGSNANRKGVLAALLAAPHGNIGKRPGKAVLRVFLPNLQQQDAWGKAF